MRRLAMLVAVMAVMPLMMGAGGSNPPPFPTKIVGTALNASVVLDPHEPGNTTTGKQASIRIYLSENTAAAMFHIPSGGLNHGGFPLLKGCDLTLTDARFRLDPQTPGSGLLINWIPQTVLDPLFQTLGVPRSPAFEPVITQIDQDDCTPDPANPTTTDGGDDLPGILSFKAIIRFQVPK